jgi:hypothetical protein
MPNQILRNSRGHKIGTIKSRGDKLEIYNSRGYFLGRFNPRTNLTHNSRGEKVGYGNLLTMLLCEKM